MHRCSRITSYNVCYTKLLRIGIYSSDPGALNVGPSTTGIAGKPLLSFQPVRDENYAITATGDGSTFNSDADYFVSFSFSVNDIAQALAGTAYQSFSASTAFRFITGTASQDNSFNQDISGMDKNGCRITSYNVCYTKLLRNV